MPDQKEKPNCNRPYNSKDKWIISIVLGLLTVIIFSPYLYSITSSLGNTIGLKLADKNNTPTVIGLILHAIIFVVIVRMMMK